MARPTHPDKDIEKALRELEAAEWRIVKGRPRGHCWGRALCPAATRSGCSISIMSTPKNCGNHAKRILELMKKCDCVAMIRKEKA